MLVVILVCINANTLNLNVISAYRISYDGAKKCFLFQNGVIVNGVQSRCRRKTQNR